MPLANTVWCFSLLLRKKPLQYIEYDPYLCFSPQYFLVPGFLFELDVALIFLLGRYLSCPFLLLLAYRLLRFFIAFSLNLPKSVSLGLSVGYLRADSCPLSIPRCLGLVSALQPYTFNG